MLSGSLGKMILIFITVLAVERETLFTGVLIHSKASTVLEITYFSLRNKLCPFSMFLENFVFQIKLHILKF